jgi:hypothetical protein
MPWACTEEVPGANPCRDTNYPGWGFHSFPHSLQVGIVPKIIHDQFHAFFDPLFVDHTNIRRCRLRLSQGEIKLSLLRKRWAMMIYGGNGGIAPPILTTPLDGGEWSTSRPWSLYPRGKGPDTHLIADWVGPRTGLDAVEKRKILNCLELNPSLPARRYKYWQGH